MADPGAAEGSESPAQLPSPTEEAQSNSETETDTKVKSVKVELLLKAVGGAPIMKVKVWMVDPTKQVTWVINFIRRYIRLAPEESLFVYVSQAFSPAPDQTIGNLLECFGSEGRLVMHYSVTQAWG